MNETHLNRNLGDLNSIECICNRMNQCEGRISDPEDQIEITNHEK